MKRLIRHVSFRRGLRAASRIHVPGVLATLALVAGALAGPLGVAPAQAATGDLICVINFQLNFSPPLTATNTTAAVDATAGFVSCGSLDGRYSNLKSATVTGSGTATSKGGVPCNLLLTVNFNKGKFTWNTQQTSDFTALVNTDPTNGPITLSATTNTGPLAGDSANAVPLVAHPNLDCALVGLTSLTAELAALTFG